ncbi:MAG: Mur ligase family protein [Patescibacteria group bacterium]|jgi:UDP-N-acetylmuramoyl-tripeptide--D-alanyl-D-alanine ligase|nr:Mur ligase family protein [Patescibacteria group bacterium]
MNNRKLKKARIIFEQHKGIKIAVLGSYGKTTTKEILSEILSGSDKKIAKTPLNKNVCLSHANWASKLDGDEDVLIIEYGEESPGDIAKLAILTKPTHVVITGIAPNHLEHFKNIDELYKEFNSIFRFVKTENVYVSSQYNEFKKDIPKDIVSYSNNGVDGWVAKDVQLFVDHTVFIASNKNVKLPIRKGLLGEHNIPAVLLSLAIGSKIGINSKGLMIGVSKLKPHSHRMSHYKLGEVDIIDDTYNGNIEGFRAGLTLLKKLKAKRKIYVTPGLVDQGIENIAVHEEIGRLIIDTNPDIVVLMNNSNTKIILQYINNKDFKGKILLEDNPLAFYQNLEHFTASGDLVLMQNDLPDEYA